jgi:hypothetical protein
MGVNRRRVLRGILNGGAVTLALPLLNCFLNNNGTALADGRPMPVRFGTWYWHLGMAKQIFVPKKTGANYDLQEESSAFGPILKDMNLLSNFTAYRDNAQNLCHHTGWVITRSGIAPLNRDDVPGETVDVTIANEISRTRRFKILTANSAADQRGTQSYENANTPNPPEYSPVSFYTKLFGPDFQDPNAPTFTPNPNIMVRKSVLSGVLGEVNDLNKTLGAEDRARLDQYVSGVRSLERQFEAQLTKPEPIAACKPVQGAKQDPPMGNEAMLVATRHKLMTDLLVMAVACDQSRVFNLVYAGGNTTKAGYEKPHHTTTHEEPMDDALGYQPVCSWFTRRAMEEWVYFVQAFSKFKEGDGSLLDNVFIMANSDHGFARVHSLDGMVMFTAGRAGGKVKNGIHIDGKGTSVTRLPYTAMRIMGLETASWGTNSNKTSSEIGEIIV